jgi:hypothetical protein
MKTQELYQQLVIEGFRSELDRHGEALADSTIRYITCQALAVALEAQRTWEKHEQEEAAKTPDADDTEAVSYLTADQFDTGPSTVTFCKKTYAMKVVYNRFLYCLVYPLDGKLYLWTRADYVYPPGLAEEVVKHWRAKVWDTDLTLIPWSSTETYGQYDINEFNPEATRGAIQEYLARQGT